MSDVNKQVIRRNLREALAAMSDADRHAKSVAACRFAYTSSEFDAAHVVMLYLSNPTQVDTASIALRGRQGGRRVVGRKVSWDPRRRLPVELSSLKDGMTNTGPVREPIEGKPIPVNLIDLVIVPGLGFTANGFRIRRGMGFYHRFLA